MRSGFTLCVGSLLLALATGLPAMAQKITVNGTIRDAAGNPVVGASIVDLKNPASGTSSGIDGAFSLSADPKAELEVSFIGYRSQRIPLNNRTHLEITLEEDTAQIDEVVVVGYGTMRKNDSATDLLICMTSVTSCSDMSFDCFIKFSCRALLNKCDRFISIIESCSVD